MIKKNYVHADVSMKRIQEEFKHKEQKYPSKKQQS